MTPLLKTITYTFLFILLLTNSIFAQDKPQAVIIFDASGSMWGQIDGKAKITIAKDALNTVVKEWSPDVELGLTAYGHRKKGDCNDIETLIPVGAVDKDKIISLVKKIQPKGKTPIARSLKKVAQELKFTEEKATIILISDGKESCDANPCAVAKELEEQGIDFVTHVIGFNVDKKTDEELECIAKSTGGEYFSAKNAIALNDAMKTIVKKVEKVEPTPTPKPTPKATPKKLKNNIEITASEKEGGKWIEANHNIYHVIDGEAEKSYTKRCWSYKKEACLEQMPLGKYLLKSDYNEFHKETSFEITAGEMSKLHIVMGQTNKLEITASEKEGGKWIEANHNIYHVIDGEAEKSYTKRCWSYKKEACLEQMPLGKYLLKSDYNEFHKETSFEVKTGEMTKLHIVMGQTNKLEITASEKEGGKWIEANHNIYHVIDGEAEKSYTKRCWSYKKEACLEQMPLGKYLLKSDYNEFHKETSFEVKTGEMTKLHIVMGQTNKLEITASEKEGGKWIEANHNIYHVIDGEAEKSYTKRCWSYKKEACLEQMPLGKYLLKSDYNEFQKETPFEIKAGEMTKLHVIFEQFVIKSKCTDSSSKVNYEIYATSGRMVAERKLVCSKPLQLGLGKGDYRVEAKIGNVTKEEKFTIGSDSNTLTLDLTNMNHEEEIKADSPIKSIPTVEPIKSSTENVTKKVEQKKEANLAQIEENPLGAIGALLGAVNGTVKESKPLQAMKSSTKIAIPYMEKTKECYSNANTLDEAKLCDNIANEGVKDAHKVMQKVSGISIKMPKEIAQKEWNEEIKKEKVTQEISDLEEARLNLVCIDKGASMKKLQACVVAKGELDNTPTELDQLGNLFNMLGGMK